MTTGQTRREFVQRAGASAVAFSSLSALIAACGGDDAEQLAEGTVSFWTNITEASDKQYLQKHVVAPLEKENSKITIDVSFRNPEDMERQVRLALQAQDAPDVISTNGPAFIPELAQAEFLADLDPYAEEGNWSDSLLSWAVDLGRVDGVLVAIPAQLETLGVFYNKSLFDERGWAVPENRSELEALADEMMADDVVPFGGGTADFPQTIEWYTSVFFSHTAGPKVMYEVLTGNVPWTAPEMVEAVTLMQDYFQRGYFGGSVERFFATNADAFHSQLAKGEAAMDMEGTWFFQEADKFFAAENADWDFAAFPSLSDRVPYPTYCLGAGGTLSINEDSQFKDASAEFIGYQIEDPARTAKWLAAQGAAFSYPLRFTADDFPKSMDPRRRDAYVSVVEATDGGNIGYTNWTFSPPKTAVYIYEEVPAVLTGDSSPEDFLQGAEDTFQEDLDDGFTPRVPNPSA